MEISLPPPFAVYLWERGLPWVTKIRKNMHNNLMPMVDKLLLRKRAIIETINDQIKNIQQIEHTRHRSVVNNTARSDSGRLFLSCAFSTPPGR